MAGIGGLISGIFGSHNDTHVDPYQTDPNAYQYGGKPGGAQAQADKYGGTAGNYTQGAYQNFTNAAGNFGAAGDDRQAAYGSRGQQQQALGLIANRAQGNDLISNQVAGQQANQLQAQQQSAAAGARGPAALALAQQGAAANTAAGQSQIAGQAMVAGAQEKLANEQAYFGGASGMRGQDIGQMGATTALGSAQSQSAAAQGGLGATYSGLENNVNQAQLAAQMNQQAQNSANYNAANGINAGVAGQNAAMNQQAGLALLSGASSAGSMAAGGGGGGAAASGGHIHGEKPYLVGEQGPELVVPKRDGWVLTAQQTAALRGAPPTPQQLAALPGLARGMHAPARAMGGMMLGGGAARPQPQPGAVGASPTPPPIRPQQQQMGNMQTPNYGGMTSMMPRGPMNAPMMGGPPRPQATPQTTPYAGNAGAMQPNAVRAPMMLGMRAAGGPMDAARPTWGTAAEPAEAAQLASMQSQYDAERIAQAAAQAEETKRRIEQHARDVVATAEKVHALGLAPRDDAKPGSPEAREALDAKAEERRARFTLGGGKTAEESAQKQAAAGAKDEAKKGTLVGSLLGAGGKALDKEQGGIDVGYHAAGGYTPPQLLALPTMGARAMGGPMMTNARNVSEAYPMTAGQKMAGDMVHGTGDDDQGKPDAGAGIMKLASAVDTGYHPFGDAREEGGPISKGGIKVADGHPGSGYNTRLTTDGERQFAQWKAKYAPKDSGDDYDLRGAFAAGVKPDAKNGHWPDTFKKPNHETFSDESQYAKHAPELAGHWEGDTYTPARREEGGPLEGIGSLVSRVSDHVAALYAAHQHAADTKSVAADADADYRARPASYTPGAKRSLEVYTAPATKSAAPTGSGPATAASKDDKKSDTAGVGGTIEKTPISERERAEGGPMKGAYAKGGLMLARGGKKKRAA